MFEQSKSMELKNVDLKPEAAHESRCYFLFDLSSKLF
jgi:hypothetical protein